MVKTMPGLSAAQAVSTESKSGDNKNRMNGKTMYLHSFRRLVAATVVNRSCMHTSKWIN